MIDIHSTRPSIQAASLCLDINPLLVGPKGIAVTRYSSSLQVAGGILNGVDLFSVPRAADPGPTHQVLSLDQKRHWCP